MGLKKFLFLSIPVAVLFVASCGCKKSGETAKATQSCNCTVKVEQKKVETARGENTPIITLKADTDFLPLLIKNNFKFNFYEGSVEVEVPNKKSLEKLLKLYEGYKKQRKEKVIAASAVRELIKEDIRDAKSQINYWQNQYNQYASILNAQGYKVDFSVFDQLIALKERKIFELYTRYWDNKLKQLLSGYKYEVNPPVWDISDLISKARNYYGDEIRVNLFKAYLLKKLNETRLEADLYKYKEYGS